VSANTETTADQLAIRYALVSRLADDLAHEIKNPLHAMVINLEVLRRRLTAGDAEIALERAAVIEQEIERTHHLVDLLLKLVRPDRNHEQHAHSLAGAVDEVLPLITLQAKLARVPLQCEDVDIDAPIGVSHPALKFALLALTTPVIERLRSRPNPEEGPALRLSVAHENEVRIRLSSSADALPDGRALEEARGFLRSAGGRVETAPDEPAIYLVLPRVTGA
jgi:signal transduction histidine kinase